MGAGCTVNPTVGSSPSPASIGQVERAVHRTIPMTNSIRRAFAAGTRDSSGRPGPRYWQLRVDYTINARLDPATATVSGRERIVVHNTSDSALNRIVLRLDQNIFRAKAARDETVDEATEGMVVTKISVNGQAVDMAYQPRIGPDGRLVPPTAPVVMGLTSTVATIGLPTPAAPKTDIPLEIEWNFRVPGADNTRGLRMGRWADSLFQVAQWYPRVTVYDDLRGWDTEPYLGASEFYNNFGRFDVTIDVPAGWLVGSTGVLQNPEQVLTSAARERLGRVLSTDSITRVVTTAELQQGQATASGSRLSYRFVADSVADVAWAASNHFVWDATRANIPGKGYVPIHILYVPGNAARFVQVPARVRHALEFYSELWMPYAFPQLTVVNGPEQGMEYPQFIMSGLGAADHEAGHEWWPMMVGVNETWYGWMDEGFNQYMNILSSAHRTSQAPKLDGLGQSYGQISGDELEPPMMWPANHAGPQYGFQTYAKAPLMLSMLGGIVGDSAVWRAMSDYAKAWIFKHPSPWDYMFFMNRALNRDLGWFWYYWLFTTERVDGSIQDVSTSSGRTVVTVQQAGEMPSPVVLQVELAVGDGALDAGSVATKAGNGATARMVGDRTLIVTFPVDVWFGGSRTFQANLDLGGRRVEKVTLDPGGRFPDRTVSDNIWPQ
jgi:hypothetical protein